MASVGVPRTVFIALGLDRSNAHCGHPRDGNLFVDCEAVTWQDAENERSVSVYRLCLELILIYIRNSHEFLGEESR